MPIDSVSLRILNHLIMFWEMICNIWSTVKGVILVQKCRCFSHSHHGEEERFWYLWIPQQEVSLNHNKVAVHKIEDTERSPRHRESCPLQQCLYVWNVIALGLNSWIALNWLTFTVRVAYCLTQSCLNGYALEYYFSQRFHQDGF